MNRIDGLIMRLCPDGVRLRTLGEIGELVRGNGMPKTDFKDTGVGAIHYGQIYTYYGTWTTKAISFVAPETAARLAKVDPGDVIITNTSENLEDVGKAVAWLGNEQIVTGGHATVFKHSQNPKFIAYWFQSAGFDAQRRRIATGTKVIDISAKALSKVKMPVPPPVIQDEIVSILDKMENLEARLEGQLQAELELRTRQYAYCRDALWSPPADAEWLTVRLGDVVDLQVGYAFKSNEFSSELGGTKLLRGDNIGQGRLKVQSYKRWMRSAGDGLERYELKPGDVVLAMDRPWIPAGLKWAKIDKADLPLLLVQRVARLRGLPRVLDQDFLASVVGSPAFTRHVLDVQSGNTVPHISGRQIENFSFQLPPVADQIRLAAVVHKFDALVHELSIGILAEIRSRQQQYAYYRDRLLTFEEAA